MTIDSSLFTTQASQLVSPSTSNKQNRTEAQPNEPSTNRHETFKSLLRRSHPALSDSKPGAGNENQNQIKVNLDLNNDGVVNINDLNMQLAATSEGKDMSYDHNHDGVLDSKDTDILLAFWGTEGDMIVSAPDLNADGTVDVNDLNEMLANYGSEDSAYDLNGDGVNDQSDLNVLLSFWGDMQTA